MKIGEESIVFLVAVSLWERTLEKNRKVEKKTFISDCLHVLEGGGGDRNLECLVSKSHSNSGVSAFQI